MFYSYMGKLLEYNKDSRCLQWRGFTVVVLFKLLSKAFAFCLPEFLLGEMVWLLRKSVKRPVVLVGAACTSVLVGVVIFDRLFYHPWHVPLPLIQQRCSSCSNASGYSSYAKLRQFEATRYFKDSVVKRLDVVYLGSNSPIEDRFVAGVSENLGAAFFSIIDGHKGALCAQYLQENMLQHVLSHLQAGADGEEDLRVVLDMDAVQGRVDRGVADKGEEGEDSKVQTIGIMKEDALKAEELENRLRESLVSLDDKISQQGLEEVKLLLSGRFMDPDMRSRIMTAIEGACALTAVVRRRDVFVANTGDCRVVLGRSLGKGKWKALPLSVDQNAENPEEVERLQAAHPGEEGTVIFGGRVLGNLMPFRTFGDVDYKWENKYLEKLVQMPFNYKTPPYVTAEPVTSRHSFQEGDRFLILATDGLWERVSNEDAVNTVAHALSHSDSTKHPADSAEPCCKVNSATELLWMALGGNDSSVTGMLQLDPRFSRMYRDDITIMVVYL